MARRGLASARPAGEKASADILACAVNYVITRRKRRISAKSWRSALLRCDWLKLMHETVLIHAGVFE